MKKTNKIFGQLIIGSPGSGKTTYLHKLLNLFCSDELQPPYNLISAVLVINLDPSNNIEIEDSKNNFVRIVNISNYITINDIYKYTNDNIGYNGALLFALRYFLSTKGDIPLLASILNKIIENEVSDNSNTNTEASNSNTNTYYILIDTPGQLEIFNNNIDNSLLFPNNNNNNTCNNKNTYFNFHNYINFLPSVSTFSLSVINFIESQNLLLYDTPYYNLINCLILMFNLSDYNFINVISKSDLISESELMKKSENISESEFSSENNSSYNFILDYLYTHIINIDSWDSYNSGISMIESGNPPNTVNNEYTKLSNSLRDIFLQFNMFTNFIPIGNLYNASNNAESSETGLDSIKHVVHEADTGNGYLYDEDAYKLN